jgi:iron complex outermembrane recepter protein
MPIQTAKLFTFCVLVAMVSCPARGDGFQNTRSSSPDLSTLSLEDLTRINVSSVARKSQELFKTSAAVFVITRDDIRNSGANSLPELFRMVPGVQVAQVNANAWAVSARGFNSRFADKMLVLVDGRSIYSEIYSGVFWDQNDLPLEDIDRIEVIRGPGGTLWGANAVNGVINIITRSAKKTLGTRVVAVGGSLENGGSLRYGAELGPDFQYRGYLKYLRRNALSSDEGGSANDAGQSFRAGGRGDWQATPKDLVTVHGDFFRGNETQRIANFSMTGGSNFADNAVKMIGGYALGRWEHRFTGSDFALQTYYTDSRREELGGVGREHILDFDFQNHLPSFHRNDIVWGVGYRLNTDHISAAFSKDHHRDVLQSLFFEDEYAIVPRKLVFIGGFKLQHNSYTGFEFQPGGRILWTPSSHQSIWTAVSRAVRTPSVQERDLYIFEPLPPQNSLPTEALALGNPDFHSEVVVAYEAGYRQTLGKRAWLDVATFVNHYSSLRDQKILTPYVVTSPTLSLVIPIMYTNDIAARSHGVEVAASWNPARSLQLQASYAWMNASRSLPDGTMPTRGDTWSSPTNTVSVRSTWTIAHRWTLNSSVYSVSRLERESPSGLPPTKQFVRLDTHLSFSLFESLKLTGGVNNLLQKQHPEFDPQDGYTIRSQVPRSAFAKAVWSF